MEDQDFSNHDGYGVRSPTMRDLLAIAFRHGRLLVLSFLGMLSGAILVAVLQPNRYEAGMKGFGQTRARRPVATPGAALPQFAGAVTEEELNSEVELLKSKDLLEKVVRTCDFQNRGDSAWSRVLAAIRKHTARQASEEDPQIATAVRILQKELDVEAVKKTNLIAVNYESAGSGARGRVLTRWRTSTWKRMWRCTDNRRHSVSFNNKPSSIASD